MWFATFLKALWNSLFQVNIPIFGGISFGTLLLTIFLGSVLIGILSAFNSRGE